MLPVPIPKILINDKEGSSSSLESLRPSLTKTSSESLFKYDISSNVSTTPSSPPKSDSISSEESQNTNHSYNLDDDPYVPIPECFLHSFIITSFNYRQFIKKKKIDLGCNRLGRVFRYIDNKTMMPLVGNIINLETFSDTWSNSTITKTAKVNAFIEEIKQLVALRHRRICHLYGIYSDKEKLVVFNEYLPRGSVYDKAKRHPIDEKIAIKYFWQTCEGLKYIHSNNFSHGNLRATNLLITISDEIKITDFGLSQELVLDGFDNANNERKVSNYRLRLLYAAPEALKILGSNGRVPPSSDIWALGCTLVTMLTQNPPYFMKLKDQTDQEVYKIITDNYMKPAKNRLAFNSTALIPHASTMVKELLDKTMNDDQGGRPTAEEILNWDIIKKSKAECQKALLLPLEITSERKIIPSMNNGHVHTITNEEYDKEVKEVEEDEEETDINLLLNNYKNRQQQKPDHLEHNLPKRGTTVIEMENNKDEEGIEKDADEHPIKFCFSFVGSRILIFLMLMIKWTLMVFSAACALSIVATSIFLSISIIYRLIKMSCQCELNEGFVVLIAIILLPILILLTTLCCNTACEKYHQRMDSERYKKSKLYVEEPDADVVICGVKVIPRAVSEKRKRSIASKRNKAESNDDETSPTNLPKGNVLNAIAILA
uniref:Protein kinase domain-containing protein n=1 Tax=Panagrolaimus superbus TaxID=310955 RepID=A0A914YA10_9BILA